MSEVASRERPLIPSPPLGLGPLSVRTPEAGPADISTWHNTSFLLLWLAQAISQTAQNAIWYGILILVQERSNSSTQLSLAVLTLIIPSVVFGVLAGVYVDRWDKRWVLIVTNVLRGSIAFAYALFGVASWLPLSALYRGQLCLLDGRPVLRTRGDGHDSGHRRAPAADAGELPVPPDLHRLAVDRAGRARSVAGQGGRRERAVRHHGGGDRPVRRARLAAAVAPRRARPGCGAVGR